VLAVIKFVDELPHAGVAVAPAYRVTKYPVGATAPDDESEAVQVMATVPLPGVLEALTFVGALRTAVVAVAVPVPLLVQ
jgi:hypothetical protein